VAKKSSTLLALTPVIRHADGADGRLSTFLPGGTEHTRHCDDPIFMCGDTGAELDSGVDRYGTLIADLNGCGGVADLGVCPDVSHFSLVCTRNSRADAMAVEKRGHDPAI
jgi:hypothetical protein